MSPIVGDADQSPAATQFGEHKREPKSLDWMSKVLIHAPAFFVLYLLAGILTYILPYLGSNSTLLNGTSAAIGAGALPQFWWHLTAIYLLTAIAWIRGGLIGRSWLPVLPVLAGIFDLTPGFNWIPLAPTVFHVMALIKGVTREPIAHFENSGQRTRSSASLIGLCIFAAVTIYKTTTFNKSLSDAARSDVRSFATTTISTNPPAAGSQSQTPSGQSGPVPVLTAMRVSAAPEQVNAAHLEVPLTEANSASIWSTSVYSYTGRGGGPGGGLADDKLRVGGNGDTYISLLMLPLLEHPASLPRRVLLRLYTVRDDGTPTGIRVERILEPWGWTPGDRLWWRNVPRAEAVLEAEPPTLGQPYDLDITTVYNSWLSNPSSAFGLLLHPLSNQNNYSTFASTRAISEAQRPRLIIDY